ncbi:hypothetical protein O181_041206 [Austropuccinia psidii MF-1]|uniref:CCHC-type domain-containing protein n=1 Tax=Austropuccinia psidii MF-1 TaxID=1389203 RepID=A0A9Q3HE23_9BASI|nr:hypothetical protein [Austropuccinia psidii MF-1]
MRNKKLLTKLPVDLENAVKFRLPKESTLDEISNTLQEVRIRTSIGRHNFHIPGNNRENQTLEAKEAPDPEELKKTKTCHNCRSPTHYADNCAKEKKEIFEREE